MDTVIANLGFLVEHRVGFLIYLSVVNFITLLFFGIDKHRAKVKKWRIPEARLIFFVIIGGSIGGLFGMQLFRHKTQHTKFILTVPLALAFHLLIIAAAAVISHLGASV